MTTPLTYTVDLDADTISPDSILAAFESSIDTIRKTTDAARIAVNWNTLAFGVVACEKDPSTAHLRFEMESL